jgi:PAS domain S-box-containing protein
MILEKPGDSEEMYRLLAEHVKDFVWLLDMDLRLTYISSSIEKTSGYTFNEIKKLSLKKLLTGESYQKTLHMFSDEISRAEINSRCPDHKRSMEIEFRCKEGHQIWIEAALSFLQNNRGKPFTILGEGRDITKYRQAEENLQMALKSVKKAMNTTIQVLVSALEKRDPYTGGHQSRTADLVQAIAREMGLPDDKIEGIRIAGSIHDIGKLSIPTEILSKPAKLTNIEFSIVKEHSLSGYEMLREVESPWPLAEIVYQHHERLNGIGYPRNLKGNEILLEARILAVGDVVESMASHRPYRSALGIKKALEEIEKNKGNLYDEVVVNTCQRLFRDKEYQFKPIQ